MTRTTRIGLLLLAVVIAGFALLFLGGSVSQRLGGPCTEPQRPLPSFCATP